MDQESFNALKKALVITGALSAGAILLSKSIKEPASLEQKIIYPLPSEKQPALEIRDPLNEPAPAKPYSYFPFKEEVSDIVLHAQRLDIDAELLMAVRMAENGGPGREYGILPESQALKERYKKDNGYMLNGEFRTYKSEGEKQLAWAARTIKNNLVRFEEDPRGHKDFISFLASTYAPKGVSNDPKNLNRNWKKNVTFYNEKLREQKSE